MLSTPDGPVERLRFTNSLCTRNTWGLRPIRHHIYKHARGLRPHNSINLQFGMFNDPQMHVAFRLLWRLYQLLQSQEFPTSLGYLDLELVESS